MPIKIFSTALSASTVNVLCNLLLMKLGKKKIKKKKMQNKKHLIFFEKNISRHERH